MSRTPRATAGPTRPVESIYLPDILVAEELSGILRMTPAGVRAALRAGRLPGRRVGRRWLVSRTALLAHIAAAGIRAPRALEGSDG